MKLRALAARMPATIVVGALAALAIHVPAAGAGVVLNEINCEATDWVELVNTSATPADISGWLLTDDPLDANPPRPTHQMFFPNPTVIPAGGDLVVEKVTPGGFPFGISCGDDTIRLADGTGAPVDDFVVPALAAAGDTWGRYPNGSGPWVETMSTKDAPNEPSSAGGGPPVDQAAWLFDPGKVVDIDLTLPQSSIDALATTPTEYQDATFSLTTTGGTYGPLAVGVRLKGGEGSFRPLTAKAAFKLKFNHSVAGQRFLGLKKLTLNNMIQDHSMVHEALTYEAFRSAGVAAPRTGYAYVRVNGQAYGVYLNLETLDDVSLPRWFNSTQHLYEGEYTEDVTPGGAAAYEVDEGSDADRADLEALIGAANATGADWSDGVADTADLAQMTRMWAVEKYVGHWDGYSGAAYSNHRLPNNYYLHSDAAGRFSMLPWGTDQTWADRLAFDGEAGLLFDKCLEDASCAAMYRDAVRDVAESVATLDLDSRASSIAAMLEPWQEADPRREYSMDAIRAEVSATRAYLALRPGDVDAWLSPPPPPPPPPPDEDPPPPGDDPLPAGGDPPPPLLGTSPLQPASVPTIVTPTRALGVGRPRFAAGVLTTRLALPGAGRITQRALVVIGGRIRTVCIARALGSRVGAMTVRCRLSSAAKRQLRSRKRELIVRTYFTPLHGRPTAVTRRVIG